MEYVGKGAIISNCGRYRYCLVREWDKTKPSLRIIMLNPSRADAEEDDPTIRSCVRIADHLGYGLIAIYNLFAWRATDPKDLSTVADPIGPENDHWLDRVTSGPTIVCAWGAQAIAAPRAATFMEMLNGVDVWCFGTTKHGAPKHPLYLKTGTKLVAFRREAEK